MGQEKINKFTKTLLSVMFYCGILVCLTLPVSLKLAGTYYSRDITDHYVSMLVIFAAAGVCGLLIVAELRRMMRTVVAGACFVEENVRSLKRMAAVSMIITVLFVVKMFFTPTPATAVIILTFFVAALFSLSIFSNLISLLGVFSPTADLSTEAAWAVVVFILITYNKIKAGGVLGYLKGFTEPIPVLTPFNILSELATPISMACHHFGNILSGTVINALIYGALAVASHALFGLLPGLLGDILGEIPFLMVGVPAVASLYFDWFSGFMQAFIFCMLTTMYIANAAESE